MGGLFFCVPNRDSSSRVPGVGGPMSVFRNGRPLQRAAAGALLCPPVPVARIGPHGSNFAPPPTEQPLRGNAPEKIGARSNFAVVIRSESCIYQCVRQLNASTHGVGRAPQNRGFATKKAATDRLTNTKGQHDEKGNRSSSESTD